MALTFRPIELSEVPAFCQVVDTAYSTKVKELFGDNRRGRWQHYDESRVHRYLSREAAGVRAGFYGKEMVSVCISRSYGSVGWFHTLAVLPHAQSRGIGTQTVADAEAYLKQQGVRTVGLMTWPDAVDNLAFYQRLGYRATGISLNAMREVSRPLAATADLLQDTLLSDMTRQEQERSLAAARHLCQQMLPGLDYSSWLLWTIRQAQHEAMFFWQEERLLGFAICELHPHANWLGIRLLALAPEADYDHLLAAVDHVRRWAARQRFSFFGFPLDLMNATASALAQEQGFRLLHDTMVDFIKGPLWPPQGLHMVRFAG